MRIKDNLKLRKIGSKYMVVKSSDTQVNLTDVYSLNETAAFLWQAVGTEDFTTDDMVAVLCHEYDVSQEQARADVEYLLKSWKEFGLLE